MSRRKPLLALIALVAITGGGVALLLTGEVPGIEPDYVEPTEETCAADELTPELEEACIAEGLLDAVPGPALPVP